MPIYVYKCPGCGREKEIIASRQIGYEPVCLKEGCAGYFMRRVPTSAAIHFKGSGWTPKGSGRNG